MSPVIFLLLLKDEHEFMKLMLHYDNCRSANYGAFGMVIGHEMTHGYDLLS